MLDLLVEQIERSNYMPCCDINMNSDLYEDNSDDITNIREIEQTKVINSSDMDDINKLLLTSFEFTELLMLNEFNDANCFIQIHQRISQNFDKIENVEYSDFNKIIY